MPAGQRYRSPQRCAAGRKEVMLSQRYRNHARLPNSVKNGKFISARKPQRIAELRDINASSATVEYEPMLPRKAPYHRAAYKRKNVAPASRRPRHQQSGSA